MAVLCFMRTESYDDTNAMVVDASGKANDIDADIMKICHGEVAGNDYADAHGARHQ